MFVPRCGWTALLLILAGCGVAPAEDSASASLSASVPAVSPTTDIAAGPAPSASALNGASSYPEPAAIATPTPLALTKTQDPLPASEIGFSGAQAYQYLEAYMQFQPRDPGSPGWQQAGDYIIAQLQQAGWQVEEQRFPYQGVEARNIIAKRGSGPVLIVGAHYDARKFADKDPDAAKRMQPVPGANDGGSGVAVLLELAHHLDVDSLGREVWLTFFDVEDNGEIDGWEYAAGSEYMAAHLSVTPEAMILLDMIGDADLQIYYEQNSNAALSESIWRTAAELGYKQFIPLPKYSMLDDHTAFLERGIPAVDLIDFDYPAHHTVADTIDQVSAESLEAVGRTMERWLETRVQP